MKTKNEIAKIRKEQKLVLENIMDNRDNMYIELERFENTYHYIPEKYKSDVRLMNAYAEFKRYGGWRKIPGLKAMIKKSAIKATENIINNKDEKPVPMNDKIEYLKNKMDEIFKSVEKAKKK